MLASAIGLVKAMSCIQLPVLRSVGCVCVCVCVCDDDCCDLA